MNTETKNKILNLIKTLETNTKTYKECEEIQKIIGNLVEQSRYKCICGKIFSYNEPDHSKKCMEHHYMYSCGDMGDDKYGMLFEYDDKKTLTEKAEHLLNIVCKNPSEINHYLVEHVTTYLVMDVFYSKCVLHEGNIYSSYELWTQWGKPMSG